RWLYSMLRGGPGKGGGAALMTLGRAIGATLFHGGTRPSLAEMHEWFIESVRVSKLDDAAAVAAALSLLLFLAFRVRRSDEKSDGRTPLGLWVALVGFVLLYLLLPKSVYVPIYWWAVRVRFIVPAFLVGVLCVRTARRGLPRFLLVPAFGLALA